MQDRDTGRRDSRGARDIAQQQPLRSEHIYEIIRREGDEELVRPAASLFWSGLAAGIALGVSILGETMVYMRLPREPWADLLYDAAYPLGFLIVILGRLQLFTEHTITAVTPVLRAPSRWNVLRLARLWAILFGANVLGAVVCAAFIVFSGAVDDAAIDALLEVGRHIGDAPFHVVVARGVGAGFLVAAMVWILPSARANQLGAILIVTYAIALCDFSHVIAGSVEAAAHVMAGRAGVLEMLGGFLLPSLIGNVIGGTSLFTALVYSQIRREMKRAEAEGRLPD